MAKDDFQVILFKVLSYFYECLKEGVQANTAKAQELAGCNKIYFDAVLADALNRGYFLGDVIKDMNGEILDSTLSITCEGVEFLENNSTMTKVKSLLGKAFEGVLRTAVASTALL